MDHQERSVDQRINELTPNCFKPSEHSFSEMKKLANYTGSSGSDSISLPEKEVVYFRLPRSLDEPIYVMGRIIKRRAGFITIQDEGESIRYTLPENEVFKITKFPIGMGMVELGCYQRTEGIFANDFTPEFKSVVVLSDGFSKTICTTKVAFTTTHMSRLYESGNVMRMQHLDPPPPSPHGLNQQNQTRNRQRRRRTFSSRLIRNARRRELIIETTCVQTVYLREMN